MKVEDLFTSLKNTIADAEGDLGKVSEGVVAAGTRFRKKMQEVKTLAGDIRKAVIDAQKEKKAEK